MGQVDPPTGVLGLDFNEVSCHYRGHIPFLSGQVDGNARAKDLAARLILLGDLFQSQRSIVEHSQFEIAARRKDMPLPVGFQGIGDS